MSVNLPSDQPNTTTDEPIEIQYRETLLPAYFGDFGGQYVPDPLFPVLDELEKALVEALEDREFLAELARLQAKFLGRPTPVYECANLPRVGSSRIFLKREDLAHGGAHKGNQVLAQALLAKRLGKNRLIAETGAGQHGTATAMVAALMDMECVVYMGAQDVARQQPNVRRMRLMGATVVPVTNEAGGSMSNAIDIALKDWVDNLSTTHYVLGSACGPHPFPTLVKQFQAVISRESRQQMLEDTGRLPDAVIAAVGGGSNAIGAFAEYLEDQSGNSEVKLIGVEPAGEGLDTDKHGAALNHGKIGLLHGSRSYVVTGQDGQRLPESFSVSAGLDYPGVGPEHAYLREIGRAEYVAVTDEDALQAFRLLSRYEGIIPALESSHALAYALKLAEVAEAEGQKLNLLVNLSGRGDKDLDYVYNILGDALFDDPEQAPVADIHVSEVVSSMTSSSNEREAGHTVAHK
ncbi:tryptophan synthase subunit beta [Corynebacterium cystitidis]|uniref:Tryptophan synthase beta chain n=1 Tax=Corynebacterium cystitidis DSM 20524 TaxID=1121357 RepID=A0A1H9QMG2_9CORY|nr:tryptophan synthase subunit beta [Corynebacterium cystitidis]WJY81719.1 Tryptophan synthase beta chain [Corynebacterium cystitidis DSM 20524]SER61761.1 tryptophan synthase beta chain [Corynebacterium cystitidis DSM 20524]SNV84489.1 tryptophan synthase subunit beta [Corynebacterium cystitidis]